MVSISPSYTVLPSITSHHNLLGSSLERTGDGGAMACTSSGHPLTTANKSTGIFKIIPQTCKTCCRAAVNNFHEVWSMAATALNIPFLFPSSSDLRVYKERIFLQQAKDEYLLLLKTAVFLPKTETTHGRLWSKRRQEWKLVGNTN